jgi:Xaa-Pro aminopeptidase
LQLEPTHEQHLTPPSEIAYRHTRLQAAMAEDGLDAVWIDDIVPLNYFTGSIQRATLIVPAEGTPRYVVRKSVERARVESPLDVEPFAGREALYAVFKASGIRLGVDLGAISAADHLRLAAGVGDADLVDASGILRGLRMIKSDWELEQIRRATDISTAGFEAIRELLSPGVTELELSIEVESAMRRAGHQGPVRTVDAGFEEFGPSIVSGDATMYPNNFNGSLGKPGLYPGSAGGAGLRQIRRGATLMSDISGTYNSYVSDNTRVFLAGSDLPEEAAHAHGFCVEVLRRIEALMKPGAVCEDIYDTVDRWAESAGKPEGFLGHGENRQKFLGHGVGLNLDELPVIARGIATRIERGMILAVEPKAFLPGIGPVGVENTYVITEEGCESLCGFPEGITQCG